MKAPLLNIKFLIGLVFLLSIQIIGYSQEKAALKAAQYMQRMQYSNAESMWLKAIKQAPDSAAFHIQLGIVYKKLNQYQNAEAAFAKAEELGGLTDEGRIYYGQVLISNGKFEESNKQISAYLKENPENFLIRQLIQSLDKLSIWEEEPNAFTIDTVIGVNTEFSEFGPVVIDNQLLFASARGEDLVNENGSSFNNEGYLTIYKADFLDKTKREVKKTKVFSSKLNGDYHVGPISVSADGKTLFYSKVNSSLGKGKTNYINAFSADIEKNKLKNLRPLFINTPNTSTAHPTISPNGNMICFSSDRIGGKGKMDLYLVQKTDSGWSEAVPLIMLNTELNEVFPYFLDDTTLFFSSDGLPGYGGLDVFVSTKGKLGWNTPVNLKAPLNSSKDDFGIFYLNRTRGFFSSDREGGRGKDDIYQFTQLSLPTDNARTEIAGIFEYKNLPADGITLRLIDAEDNEIMVVQTDSNGQFDFGSLPSNMSYKIEVVDQAEDYLAESDIYLTNSKGEKIIILSQESGALFAFKTLPQETIDGLARLDENDTELETYDVFGQLFTKLKRDDFSGLSINVFDEDGNFMQSAFVDESGYYEIRELSKTKYYKIELVGDSGQYSSTIFYDDGYSVKELKENNSSLFAFQKMIVSANPIPENAASTKLLVLLNGQPASKARLRVFDKSGLNVGGSLANSEGIAAINNLNQSELFELHLADSLDTIRNSKIEIYVLDVYNNHVQSAKKISTSVYSFSTLSQDQFAGTNQPKSADSYPLAGQLFFTYPGDFKEEIIITAQDKSGAIVESAKTNTNGFFKFENLKPKAQYAFNLSKKYNKDVHVYFYDKDNAVMDTLLFANLSNYVFEKLKSQEAERLAFLAEKDGGLNSDFVADLVAGQIFKLLPGDYKQGVKVYAYDDEGNVIDSAYTDAKGNFRFSQLKRDESFTLKVQDEADTELNIAFNNFEGHFAGAIATDGNNEFVYSKIILEAAAELGIDLEEEGAIQELYGQIFKKLPGDYAAGTKIYAYDSEGNIIDVAVIDNEGKFKFSQLKRDENYLFRTDNKDGDFNINILDSDGSLVDRISVKEHTWAYTQLKQDKVDIAQMDETDNGALNVRKYTTPEKTILQSSDNTIYYNFKTYKLSEDDLVVLDQYAEKLNADSSLFVDIQSHTDPTEITSQRSYSALRSVSIANYLFAKGVSLDQILITNWEDQKLAVDCPKDVACEQEDRLRNMRSELSLVTADQHKSAPDYIVYYPFDQWTLSEEGNNELFKAMKEVKSDSEVYISIDGYTDVWGGYEMNKRISDLRVLNVVNYMIKNGVPESKIYMKVHGESSPQGNCKLQYPCSMEDRMQNRRVEIRITPYQPE